MHPSCPRRRASSFLAALALALGLDAGAQAPAAAPADGPRIAGPISLPYALQVAWSRNPRVLEAERAAEAAGYAVTGAYGGFLPAITVTKVDGHGGVSSVQGSLPLWRGGATLAAINASEAREIVAQAGLVRTRLVVGNETLLAFHNLLQAQDQLVQWQKYLAALGRLRRTIENRAGAGVAPRADVETAVSRIRQAEVGQEAAALLLALSRNELARLLEFSPQAALPEADLAAAIVALVAEPLAERIEMHPDVRIAAAQVDEQDAVADTAFAQLQPEIALQYRHYYDGEQFVNDPAADEPLIVGTLPIGNSFATAQRFKTETAKVKGAKARLDAVRRDTGAVLRLTREQLGSADRQYRLQQQALDSSQALVESFLRQYQVGRRSWVEVLNAQRELHEIQLGLIAARRAWLLAGHQLALQTLAWDLLVKPADN
jgi:outer membrane protein, adhesin transport system